jgi:hypothetical protein
MSRKQSAEQNRPMASNIVDNFCSAFVGMTLAHTWRGYGSAIFFEFGRLTPQQRRDGSLEDPKGELGIMIEWDWRIERGATIVCGSSSEDIHCESTLIGLRGTSVVRIELVGRRPELSLDLSNGHRILSLRMAEGDPKWVLFDQREATPKWLCVRDGEIVVEADTQRQR